MDARTISAYEARAADFAARYERAADAGLHALLLRHLPPACRLLEIGCGSGRDAAFLAGQGFQVTATDASPAMLQAGRAAHSEFVDSATDRTVYPPAVRLLQAAFPLPADSPLLKEKFRAIVALAVVMHMPDQDLFEFAFQVRSLLEDNGTLIIATSRKRPGLDVEDRDGSGRLFRERLPAELRVLFERLGFVFVSEEQNSDGLSRGGIQWVTLVFRLESCASGRPVDKIETIINRDRKTATYKFALLRALCEIAQSSYHHVQWHQDDTVSVPLGLVTEKWLYYYWPLVEAGISQIRGQGRRKPEAFRRDLDGLISHFRGAGGLDAFHAAYQGGRLTDRQAALVDAAMNSISNTIVVGPVTFASQGDFSFGGGPRSAKGCCATPDSLLRSLGRVRFRADVWREMCLVGQWIGEAIVLRWAELTRELTEKQVSVATALEKLLVRPETERDVAVARGLFEALAGLACVWTDKPLTGGFDVDHVVPFSLWRNNDLWNLLPTDPAVNNRKRDRLVSRHLLLNRRDRIIDYWQYVRSNMSRRFDVELNRSLLGRNFADQDWEKPAFGALIEVVETLALQRGVERWEPEGRAPRVSGAVAPRVISAERPEAMHAPAQAKVIRFAELGADAPFHNALPLVAALAAGPLGDGFEARSMEDWEAFDWVTVPEEIARVRRLVVLVTGNSMEPTIGSGDLVVFEYHRTPRRDGQIVIAADFSAGDEYGECAVKRYREAADTWLFVSDNAAYEPIRIAKSAQAYPILGTAVWNLSRNSAL